MTRFPESHNPGLGPWGFRPVTRRITRVTASTATTPMRAFKKSFISTCDHVLEDCRSRIGPNRNYYVQACQSNVVLFADRACSYDLCSHCADCEQLAD